MRWLCPGPAAEAYSAPTNPVAGLRGREGGVEKGKGRGKRWKMRERKGGEKGTDVAPSSSS